MIAKREQVRILNLKPTGSDGETDVMQAPAAVHSIQYSRFDLIRKERIHDVDVDVRSGFPDRRAERQTVRLANR